MKKIILSLFLVFALAGNGWGVDQNIYISSSATAGGDGSITTPYDTFSDINWTTGGDNSIFDWVTAEDDVFINLKGGDTFNDRLQIAASGATDHRITVQGYGTGWPIINVADDIYSQISVAAGYDHIRITGIKFEGTPKYYSINFLGNDDVILDGCEFYDSKSVKFLGNSASFYDNIFMRNRDSSANSVIHINEGSNVGESDLISIFNNRFINCYTTEAREGDGHMIGLAGGATDSRTIKHVTIYNNYISGSGLLSGKCAIVAYNSEDVTLLNNTIVSGFQGGIEIGTNNKDVIIQGNIIAHNRINDGVTTRSGGILVSQSTGGCETCTTIDGITIANNTIFDNDDLNSPELDRDGIALYTASIVGFTLNDIIVKNNICYNNFTSVDGGYGYEFSLSHLPNPTITNLDIDKNNYYRSIGTDYLTYWTDTGYTVAQWANYKTASSQDTNSIITDPILFSTGKISSQSPCVDTGTWITGVNDGGESDPWGYGVYRLPNIGADQGAGIPKAQIVIPVGR